MIKKRIGIIGGTFNPIHNGHLMIAENARWDFDLDEVWFIPAHIPPHKQEQNILNDQLRMEMVDLAVADTPYFKTSDYEIKQNRISYTYETLSYFNKQYPDHDFFFIMGGDSLFHFNEWKNPEIILKCAHIIVAARNQADIDSLKEKANELVNIYGGKIYILSSPKLDISSTMLRKRSNEGKSLRYFVPDSVNTFIRDKGIYQGVI